jgi:hypothetical protein
MHREGDILLAKSKEGYILGIINKVIKEVRYETDDKYLITWSNGLYTDVIYLPHDIQLFKRLLERYLNEQSQNR